MTFLPFTMFDEIKSKQNLLKTRLKFGIRLSYFVKPCGGQLKREGAEREKRKKKIIENRCCCQRRCTSTSLEPRQSYRQDLSRRLIYSKNYSKLRYSLDFPFDYNFRALLCLSTFSLLFMFVIILKTLCCKPSRLFFSLLAVAFVRFPVSS